LGIFDRESNFFVSHRGFMPLAPENSLPSFYYAGLFGQWAIETDVHLTKDGEIVCCHNDSIEQYTEGTGRIKDMTYNELSRFPIVNGNRVNCFSDEERRIPKFSEYLEICRKFGCVPFIELKTSDVEAVFSYMHKCGFADDEVVISSGDLDSLIASREVSKDVFVHWIFAEESKILSLAELKNAGLSWGIANPFDCPKEKIDLVHAMGMKVCLRAADNISDLAIMKELGLDYFPTNTMHKQILKG